MQRNVPQFIEIEDKIFGPFTLRQFAYLAGGFGLIIIIWRSMPLSVGIFLMGPVAGLAGALAFAKFNSKPFIDIIRAALYFVFSKKMYLWQNPSTKQSYDRLEVAKKEAAEAVTKEPTGAKTFNKSDIQDLAKRLNSN